jgi:hypothetical protein
MKGPTSRGGFFLKKKKTKNKTKQKVLYIYIFYKKSDTSRSIIGVEVALHGICQMF